MSNDEMNPDGLLLYAILDRPDGDILNIVQAAAELPGTMYDRLSKAYMEVTRGPLTEAEENSMISLKPSEFNFEPGKRYRIVHQSHDQRYARVSVMDYLGTSGVIDELSFSARPVAGTQQMPRTWVKEAHEVPKTTPIFINRRA